MSMRGARIALTAAAAAAALVGGLGVGTALASDAGTGARSAIEQCQPGTLTASLDAHGSSQVGMNHEGTFLRLKNTGGQTCTLSGYAGLALEGAGHTALKTSVRHGDTYFAADPGVHKITLKPGASAWADVVWTHTGASAVNAKYLQISPTGSNAHNTVAFDEVVDNGAFSLTAWSATPPSAG